MTKLSNERLAELEAQQFPSLKRDELIALIAGTRRAGELEAQLKSVHEEYALARQRLMIRSADATTAEAELAKCREALRPFANMARRQPIQSCRGEYTRPRVPNDPDTYDYPHDVTWGCLRRAASCLREGG